MVEDLRKYIVPDHNESGIANMGNTCFMNSVLFCLNNTIPLVEYLLSQEFRKDMNPKRAQHKLLYELYRVVEGLWEDNCIVRPKAFKTTLEMFNDRYKGWMQHDAHELLVLIIDVLHEGSAYSADITTTDIDSINHTDIPLELVNKMTSDSVGRMNDILKSEYSFFAKNFFGQFHSTMTCNLCGGGTDTYDPFTVVELPITDINTLDEALQHFTHPEVLDDMNRWKCEHCGGDANAQKQIAFWHLPPILVFSLKRFSVNHLGIGSKDFHFVDFPLTDLDLSPYNTLNKPAKYELYAVTNHIGGIAGGHYFAYCKSVGGVWREHNDASVGRVGKVATANAYLLFYKKVE